jgi:NitT/TauT family transport system substrate-binding protein
MTVHSRGSGTEAIVNLMAQRHGIEYAEISFVPGSEVRAGAMLQGTIHATIVDAANRRLLEREGGDRFALLEMGDINATDEALYANTDYLANNQASVDILVEELIRTTREINANPAVVADLRQQYNLLAELPADQEAEMVPYYEESVASGAFPANGGGETAVKDDFDFYSIAGQLEGDPATLQAADFWEFGPLNRALEKLGAQ